MTNKLRTYNNEVLGNTYVLTSQIEAHIDALVEANPNLEKISDLPDSLVPTNTLYSIVLCYNLMYNILVASHLKEDGYPKQTTTIH